MTFSGYSSQDAGKPKLVVLVICGLGVYWGFFWFGLLVAGFCSVCLVFFPKNLGYHNFRDQTLQKPYPSISLCSTADYSVEITSLCESQSDQFPDSFF